MGRPDCGGFVETLKGQRVLFTGTSYVDGEHVRRKDLAGEVIRLGARAVHSGTRNRGVTLLVQGDLTGNVTDPRRGLSQNARFVHGERAAGNHICIVDDQGITSLLRHDAADCLETRHLGGDNIEFTPPSVKPEFRPLQVRQVPTHEPTGLEVDLAGLDCGTAAHEGTIEALRAHLAPLALEDLSRPKVDAVWRSPEEPGRLWVVEVKSLTGARQEQQIRLGIGQVLDYVHTIRSELPESVDEVEPVLVLEREPEDARWSELCRSLGILITWAPNFVGVGSSLAGDRQVQQ